MPRIFTLLLLALTAERCRKVATTEEVAACREGGPDFLSSRARPEADRYSYGLGGLHALFPSIPYSGYKDTRIRG